jgi:hypothetical protein
MRGKEVVRVQDRLTLRVRDENGQVLETRESHGNAPCVEGLFRLRVKNENGETVPGSERTGKNIWTITGREYLVELMSLLLLNPTRTPVRDDRILYIGLGQGSTAEVAEVQSLVDPVEYRVGEFLAQCQVPTTFPADADGTSRTSVQFVREFAGNEVSLGSSIIVTEAGLFTDGDPDNNYSVPCPTDFATAASRPPMAYKSFEPVTKPVGNTLEVVWEIRIR